MIEILRTVRGGNGSAVLEWTDGKLNIWLSTEEDGETRSVTFDRLGIYTLYADLAVINAAAGGFAHPPREPLEAT